MMGRQMSLPLIPLVILLAAICGCTNTNSGKADVLRVRLALGGRGINYLPADMPAGLGHYREQNLDVDLQDVGTGSRGLQSLLGGSSDVAAGYYDQVLQIAAEGRPVTAFVSLMLRPGHFLVVAPRAKAHVRRVADLKGKRVGVSAPGASTHILLNYLLRKHGLRAADVTPIAYGTGPTAAAALEQGRVDAGVMATNAVLVVKSRHPDLTTLADISTPEGVRDTFGSDVYPATILFARTEWVHANKEVARRLATACVRTLEWLHQHSPEEIRQRMPGRYRTADAAADMEAIRITVLGMSRDGVMPAHGAEAVRASLMGLMSRPFSANFDIRATYTNEFVNSK
jgi:NitT/TauT family transport system substrate-binding protein